MSKYKKIIVDLSDVKDEEFLRKLLSEFKLQKWTREALTGYWIKEFPKSDAEFIYKQIARLRPQGLKLCMSK